VESDHQDYFPTYDDIRDAFVEYVLRLPPDGLLIYCADEPGACEVTELALKQRPDIKTIPYGFSAKGDYRIESYELKMKEPILPWGDLALQAKGGPSSPCAYRENTAYWMPPPP